MSLSLSPPDLTPNTSPPVVPWLTWYGREQVVFQQGQHVLICGPTQSGKTTLSRHVARVRTFTVVLGTKPNQDPSLVAYEEEGYLRIDHWPPTRKDWREMPTPEARFLVWPEMVKFADAHRYTPLYAKVMEDVYVDGRWCLVIDEGLWMADARDGLGLGGHLSVLAYGSASNKVSMILLAQRPANIPPITWTSVSQALIFHMGRTDDVRELASLGTYSPSDAVATVQRLEGHQFLDLPVRAQASWSISEVDPAWV